MFNQLIQTMVTMMILSMGMGMAAPVMLQAKSYPQCSAKMKTERQIRQKIKEFEEIEKRALLMTTEMDEALFWIEALKWVLGEKERRVSGG